MLDALEENFPDLTVTRTRFEIDGARASCGGATTTLDLMLHLIESHHGATLALEVAALFMYGEQPPMAQPDRLLPNRQVLRAAAALMRRNIETPLQDRPDRTRPSGLSQRTLELTFKAQADQTPSRLYRAIRLAEARRRLETTRESIAEIATRTGYDDPTAMTRAFRTEYGDTPSAVRKSARTQEKA